MMQRELSFTLIVLVMYAAFSSNVMTQEIVGIQVTPHQFSDQMRWRRPPNS